jgi:starch-binding outer membrane protein SusE/F
MKLKNLLLYIFVIALFACEKDEEMVKIRSDATPAVITSTPAELTTSISEETLNDEITINWHETDYGVSTEVNYVLELDVTCNNFQNPISLGSTTNASFKITHDLLNSKLINDLKLAHHHPAEVQLRVVSKVKGNFGQTSEPVSFSLTPWRQWSKGLWLLSASWSDASAPAIYATGNSSYEGYAYLGNDDAFRFANTRSCDKEVFGGSSGQLAKGEASTELSVVDNGYYRIKADPENLTYELTRISSFGLIGTATQGGWSTSTAMTYNAAGKVWEVTADLTSGALKFRANNEWTINYGPEDGSELSGTLLLDDPGAISIEESGNYTITIDFSKTKSPDYTYTIKKNQAGEAPLNLWLPGEYQGWNPAAAPTIKSINANSFEGYVYISSPTGYKFTSAPDWNHINYGDSGTPGVLTTDGLANSLGVSSAGVYKFNVNVNTLTYTADLISTMGMIGTATPGSWDTSSPLTYDQANDVWTATINLVPGALKFRANNAWTINYGPADSGALEGTLIFDDPGAINITEAGSYTVTVDFSRDEAPYKYSYRVIKN